MIAFFPCLSPDGLLIAAERQDGNGVKVAWMDRGRVVSAVGDGPGILINGSLVHPNEREPNAISAGGGTFCADYWINDGFKGLKLFDGSARVEIPGGYASAMSDGGYLVYLTGHDDRTQRLVDLDGYVYDEDEPLEYPSCSRLGVVYSKYTGRTPHAKETWGALRHEQGQRFHASGEMIEHGPVAIDTPDGLFVGAFRDDGVVLYKAGEQVGYFHPSENARNMDAKWDGRGVRLVWNRPDGTLEERHQLLTDPRVSISAVVPSTPLPIPPVIAPEPETSVPDLPDYSVFVRDFLAPRLTRFEGDEDRTRAHSFDALNACADALHRQDPRVGLLKKTGGAQVRDRAADVIAIDLGNGTCQLFDAISDAEGHDGTPRADWRAIEEHEAGIRPISEWRAPFPVSVPTEPGQPPTQPPTTPPATGCTCAAEVAKVRQDITALTDMLLMLPANLAGLVEQIMDEKLSELPAPEPSTSFPAYEGRIFGQKVRLEPKV
jgi:hypothetical protein